MGEGETECSVMDDDGHGRVDERYSYISLDLSSCAIRKLADNYACRTRTANLRKLTRHIEYEPRRKLMGLERKNGLTITGGEGFFSREANSGNCNKRKSKQRR